MKPLNIHSIGNIRKFATTTETEEITLLSPALSFFTDFTVTRPLVIESNISAVDTERLMKKAHVRLKLVLDEKGELLGIVSADDLLERKIVQKLDIGIDRKDLSITDFMTPREKLNVLDFNDVEKSNIGKVIHTLKNSGQQHCLVVDSDKQLIRGLFSVNDISRKLKIEIDVQDQPSFSKLAIKLD
ncbi:CBS domain-containing protein [Alteromonas sp. 5E99-2]|uniref:CBS domain-containing protein n=1 Tax=Alteromonas sp. 5E99-2 TaxID=2817683 RepID=UPI001A985636|nr:CBS domain-containing protein [Alteromonas sp. 5E99-2]MBO1256327.1 CBS domain-containing protein [Alteromonas sp. 5E99-2]